MTKIHNDWRLPTIQELATLINYEKYNPASDLEDTLSNAYWSSTTYAYSAISAWYVYFYYGFQGSYLKASSLYVRCVRDGLDGLEWSKSSSNSMTWHKAIEYAKSLNAEVYYKG